MIARVMVASGVFSLGSYVDGTFAPGWLRRLAPGMTSRRAASEPCTRIAAVRGLGLVRREDEFGTAMIAQLPALRRYAMVLVGNRAAADDLVQDCVERALRQSARLAHLKQIGGWLRSILHNLHIDEIRRRRRQGPNVDIDDNMMDVEKSGAAGFAHSAGGFLDLDRALATLSLEHRQVLLLAGLEGLNYREIAAELTIPVGTVMSRLARARARLREALEPASDQQPALHKAKQ